MGFEANVRKVIRREQREPERWWFVQFSDGMDFLGAVFVRSHGIVTAAQKCHQLGINPGGRALASPLMDGHEPSIDCVDRLLSQSELESMTISCSKDCVH